MDNDAPELLPCPFCGGEASMMQDELRDSGLERVMCMTCYAVGPECYMIDGPSATDMWNTRAARARPKVKALAWAKTFVGGILDCESIVGMYEIWKSSNKVRWEFYDSTGYAAGSGTEDSVDEAKAAAQSDYEHRILSALEQPEDGE